MTAIEIEKALLSKAPLFDVRSPSEYAAGHIPGAFNLPLFSDDERKIVGTLYKQEGSLDAFFKGLAFVREKLTFFLEEVKRATSEKEIGIYCARGGLRSFSMARFLTEAGYTIFTVKNGYKGYRRLVLSGLQNSINFRVVGGYSGAGKTDFLKALAKKGYQTLDLEELANHRGSVFGKPLEGMQPTHEMFENLIFSKLQILDNSQPVWIEDESRMIGTCCLPDPLYKQMQNAPLLLLKAPLEKRMRKLLQDYSHLRSESLFQAVAKLKKRLGSSRVEAICKGFLSEDRKLIVKTFLSYYDKTYDHNLRKRPGLIFESLLV